MFKPGDAVIYVGKPTNQLLNGDLVCIDRIDGDHAILFGSGFRVPLSDLYQLRDFDLNEEIVYAHYHDSLFGTWTLPMEGRSHLILRGVAHLCTPDRIVEVDISDIECVTFDLPKRVRGPNCICCDGKHFITTDMDKPIFSVYIEDGMTSSCRDMSQFKYLSLDGKHRLEKRMYYGLTTIKTYLFGMEELIPYCNH